MIKGGDRMNSFRMALFLVFLCFVSLLGACRATEGQFQSVPPSLLQQVQQSREATEGASSERMFRGGTKTLWFSITVLVLLGGFLLVFVPERESKKKALPKRKTRSSNSRRRKE